MDKKITQEISRLSEHDVYLFKEGMHRKLYDKFGAHLVTQRDTPGVAFTVWAPNAKRIAIIGDFNGWDGGAHEMHPRDGHSGIWECFVAGLPRGSCYKYHVTSRYNDYSADKGDPFALRWEQPPRTASVVWDLDYEWKDQDWMQTRVQRNALGAPWAIYEVHLGSWRRIREAGNQRFSTYRELAPRLADYVQHMGFTHVEFLPVMEHPFYGSWGYQTTGYFAPTARYGDPQDFMYLIDCLHQRGIGVILDWVPSHFPDDVHGLVHFDGTHLYEHADPKRGFHPEWNSHIFNYGRHEVRAFLISSANFWLEKYHVDGLRVDAVASMLYLDYARKPGEWIPNEHGGNENLEAIAFIKKLNESVYEAHPGVQTIAEESTAWPMVTRPIHLGGLGFGMKWNMGWMHDTLAYFSTDSIYRKFNHNQLTFSIWYVFSENFLLALSHDEVVYGKGSLLRRMLGDEWQKFANLRLLFGYMYAHPGKKLLFMGAEFGQWDEWFHEEGLDWKLLESAPHRGAQNWVRDLNHLYCNEPVLYEWDFVQDGFEWINFHDWEKSIISFIRRGRRTDDIVLVVCNFTPVVRINYTVGAPRGGWWQEVLNSDASVYGGSGQGNFGGVEATSVAADGRAHSLSLTLPPLSILLLKSQSADEAITSV